MVPRSILCVHPNGELYGSDRVFVQTVQAFRTRWPGAAITTLLPGEGLLADELRRLDVAVTVDDLFVLRRSHLRTLPFQLWRLRRRIGQARAAMGEHDLVYLSTVVLLDFLLASRARRGATLIHVHELPGGRSRPIFAALLGLSRGRILFISDAVRRAFGGASARPERGRVVWNGTRAIDAEPLAGAETGAEPLAGAGTRAEPLAGTGQPADRPLRVLMIGRFNAWKGQGVLLDALAGLDPAEREGVRVRMVGSAFKGQDHFTRAIEAGIAAHGLGETVECRPFLAMPDEHYRWADVVVVPSTMPEPFGLVAIEGMAAGRPVIASDHGGLAEIVVPEETGLLVPPADPGALARALLRYAGNRALLRRHGEAGRARFRAEFHEELYRKRVADAAAEALATAR